MSEATTSAGRFATDTEATASSYGEFDVLSSGTRGVVPRAHPQPHRRQGSSSVSRAVYDHIRAMRTLGRTTVNSADIAKALGLSRRDVEAAIVQLSERGVKVIG